MAVITISRQLGSLGRDVARLAAECLGWRLVWREMINEAARRAGAPEMALASIDELGLFNLKPSVRVHEAYIAAVQQVMEELAHAGDVIILGRAGQMALHDWPGVLHVRVIAPAELRAQRVAAQQSITLGAAQAQVQASDNARRAYLRRFYHEQWDKAVLYDLIINTARVTPQAAAEIICHTVQRLGDAAPSPVTTTYEGEHS